MKATTIQVRCTEEQKDIILTRMKKAGFSNMSEYCRVKLTEGEILSDPIIQKAIESVPTTNPALKPPTRFS